MEKYKNSPILIVKRVVLVKIHGNFLKILNNFDLEFSANFLSAAPDTIFKKPAEVPAESKSYQG